MRVGFQVFFQRLLVGGGTGLGKFGRDRHAGQAVGFELHRETGEVDAVRRELALEVGEQLGAGGMREVHLVHEQGGGHAVLLEQVPEREGVALHAAVGVDEQDGVVQDVHHALRFASEIDVTGRVEERQLHPEALDDGLLRVYGDAALLFELVVVEVRVLPVDASQLAHRAGSVEQRFGERRLSRVDVGEYADDCALRRGISHGRLAPIRLP